MDFDKKLKIVRIMEGYTQKEFGLEFGLNQQSVSELESGKKNPSKTLLSYLKYRYLDIFDNEYQSDKFIIADDKNDPSIDAWLNSCREKNIPYVVAIRQAERVSIEWDIISFSTKVEEYLHSKEQFLVREFKRLYKSYSQAESNLSSCSYCHFKCDGIKQEASYQLADELFDIIYILIKRFDKKIDTKRESPSNQNIIQKHQALVKKFKNPDQGLRINQIIIILQEINPKLLEQLEEYLSITYKTAQTMMGNQNWDEMERNLKQKPGPEEGEEKRGKNTGSE